MGVGDPEVDGAKERWREEVSQQRSLTGLEEKVLFDLLEECLRVELLASNQRRSDGELETLRERLSALATEKVRLDEEAEGLDTDAARDSRSRRQRALGRQREEVERALDVFAREDERGRRRRSRDRLWLEALLLERERLALERRRLSEQTG